MRVQNVIESVHLEGCLSTNIASPFHESVICQRARRPRNYTGLWIAANKSVCLTEETLEELRFIKDKKLDSNHVAIPHLIACHEYFCIIERLVVA